MASDNTKKKVIHCRLTEDEHKAIAQAAQDQGTTITKFVVKAALANENRL